MNLTWSDIGICFAFIVVFSFIAGFIDTWWQDRKFQKEIRKESRK